MVIIEPKTMMASSNNTVPIKRPFAVRFSTYTSQEIRRLSVKQITNVHTFDRLMNPNHGGLCDPALGPIEPSSPCSTCGQIIDHCPGHFGHIELRLPVYQPLFFKHMLMLLKGMCLQCHRLQGTPAALNMIACQLKLLEYGLVTTCNQLPEIADAVAHTICNTQDISYQQIQDGIIHAINLEVQQAIDNLSCQDTKTKSKWNYSKNVTECRRLILHQFFHYCMSHGSKKCTHCKGPPHVIRAQHHAKVFYKQVIKSSNAMTLTKITKNKASTAKKRNKKKVTKNDDDDDNDDNLESKLNWQGNYHHNVDNINHYNDNDNNQLDEDFDQATDFQELVENTESSHLIRQVTNKDDTNKQDNAKVADHYSLARQKYMHPLEIRYHLQQLWKNETQLLTLVFGTFNTFNTNGRIANENSFFLDIIPVPPIKFRPVSI